MEFFLCCIVLFVANICCSNHGTFLFFFSKNGHFKKYWKFSEKVPRDFWKSSERFLKMFREIFENVPNVFFGKDMYAFVCRFLYGVTGLGAIPTSPYPRILICPLRLYSLPSAPFAWMM